MTFFFSPDDTQTLIIEGLKVEKFIGVYPHEKTHPQNILIHVFAHLSKINSPEKDHIDQVICYEKLINQIKEICKAKHHDLVETLAQDIANHCLIYQSIESVQVRIEKIEVFKDTKSVGIHIQRHKTNN